MFLSTVLQCLDCIFNLAQRCHFIAKIWRNFPQQITSHVVFTLVHHFEKAIVARFSEILSGEDQIFTQGHALDCSTSLGGDNVFSLLLAEVDRELLTFAHRVVLIGYTSESKENGLELN